MAHIRVLLIRDEDAWVPTCGRIDVSRPEDQPVVKTRPIGGARLLIETIPLDEFAERLATAFAGNDFVVDGESVAGHGMDGAWIGAHRTDDWLEYGTRWPIVEFAAMKTFVGRPYLHNVFESEGSVEALDGIRDCLRTSLGYWGARDMGDSRGNRFGIYLWDYRGVFRRKRTKDVVCFVVDPPDDSSLKLATVVRHDGGITARTFRQPQEVTFPIVGMLHRLNMTLRHDDDIVCELLWDENTERLRLEHDGVYMRPPVNAQADPIDAGSTIAEVVLPFMVDKELSRMVARDLGELDSAIGAANIKSAVILAGSIVEAVLLDVLARNEHEARLRMRKRWPNNVSAKELIDVASSIQVALPDGTTPALLPPLTGKKGFIVIDHRDLIHPRAEVRGATTIDTNTVQTMRGILGEILRDLGEAHRNGVLDAYAAGNVVQDIAD